MIIKKNYKFYKTREYQEWLQGETEKSQFQVEDRLSKIELEGHFGNHKYLDDYVWELKWLNGRRVYYAYLADLDIILLLGGNKNGQKKDISQSKKIFNKYRDNKN